MKYDPAANHHRQFEQEVMPSSEVGAPPQADIAHGTHANATPSLVEVASVVEPTTGAMTKEELISRAKHHIEIGETSRNASFRAAAEDIWRACDQGAKQREVARGVGKSVAWVNRLLKWRERGYVGAPFADKVVQGVNKGDAPPVAAPTQTASDFVDPSALTDEAAAASEGEYPAARAITQATSTPSDAPLADYYRLQALNRQDPERAFQRLADEWSSIAFRDLLLDSPKAAQERFVRDVLLADLSRPKPVAPLPPIDWGAR
ncbi:hypothetical protein [Bradyrhizobium elkanii]|uniref:hypothetical protein n=1 Tax=Bradyrhizobium elkanii TaxID=29448 RepID=UPI00272AC77F|nr:hypothetical protein [Bradyrhizobium elkanii]WLA81945.1 hypothetical protein QNJ99_42440 [Bradyrhizobium elkanii]